MRTQLALLALLALAGTTAADGATSVRAYVAAFDGHDLDSLLELAHPEIEWFYSGDNGLELAGQGKSQLRSSMAEYFESCPSCGSSVDITTVHGDIVSAVEHATWESGGETRRQSSLSVYELDRGLVRRVWYYPAVQDAESDGTEIEERGRSFSQAYVTQDLAAIADLYTEDAVIFPNGSASIQGRTAILDYWTLAEGRRVRSHRIEPDELRIEGALAYDYGYYELAGSNGDRDWGPIRGRYLILWRRDYDGVWRMQLDMWNQAPDAPSSGE